MNYQQKLFDLHRSLTTKALSIMEAKNHDYASGGGDPFANFRGSTYLGIHPVLGMQLRQQDKMARVKTFVEKGQLKVKGESVEDAILDQINYLVLQYAFIQFGDKTVSPNKEPTIEPEQEAPLPDGFTRLADGRIYDEVFMRYCASDQLPRVHPMEHGGVSDVQEDLFPETVPYRPELPDRGISGYDRSRDSSVEDAAWDYVDGCGGRAPPVLSSSAERISCGTLPVAARNPNRR